MAETISEVLGSLNVLFSQTLSTVLTTLTLAVQWLKPLLESRSLEWLKPLLQFPSLKWLIEQKSEKRNTKSITSPALTFKEKYGQLIKEGSPSIYSITGCKIADSKSNIRKFEFGEPSRLEENRTILLLGHTNSKLEWIDGLINHFLGVEFSDTFRFHLTNSSSPRPKSSSFTFHHVEGAKVDCSLTIVNVVHLVDTLQELENVDAVCFVLPSSSEPDFVRELVSLQSYFHKSLSENVRWIVTSHDGCGGVEFDDPEFSNVVLKFYRGILFAGKLRDPKQCDQRLSNWHKQEEFYDSFLSDLTSMSCRDLQFTRDLLNRKNDLEQNSCETIDRQLRKCKAKYSALIRLHTARQLLAEKKIDPEPFVKPKIKSSKKRLSSNKLFSYFCTICQTPCELIDKAEKKKISSSDIQLFWRSCSSGTCGCPGNRHVIKNVDKRVTFKSIRSVEDIQTKMRLEEMEQKSDENEKLTIRLNEELMTCEIRLINIVKQVVDQWDNVRRSALYVPSWQPRKSVSDWIDEAFIRCTTLESPRAHSTGIDLSFLAEWNDYRGGLMSRLTGCPDHECS